MLKQRIITALILMAAFLAALLFLPIPLFSAFVAVAVLVAAWEWANLAGFESVGKRLVYVALTAVGLAIAAGHLEIASLSSDIEDERFRQLLLIGCGAWAVALLLVQGYPSSAILWGHRFARAAMGLIVLIVTWASFTFVRAHEQGIWLILLIVAIVACADIGGYFFGRRWGKRKLALAVSPGKTWEGFAGGVFCNFILSVLIWLIAGGNYWQLLAIILPTSLISVVGDLFESMLKRHRGIKDSSNLLPGHGGVLDRVDSLTAAAPVFALALLVSGWFG